ncbi:MAG: glycosyl transferase family protein, partial [bacterium]
MKPSSWQDLASTATLDIHTSRPSVSIIIPVYNEEESVETLQERLSEMLAEIKIDYEIIYVDDGSRDNSFQLLEKLALKDSRIKLIKFRKNHGQTAAMSAAIDVAQAEIIIPLDADLQNDPRDIPSLLDKMAEGYDVVSGWR